MSQGGYSGFQVMGMIDGVFLGLKCSIPGFSSAGKFGKYFFVCMAWFKGGTYKPPPPRGLYIKAD